MAREGKDGKTVALDRCLLRDLRAPMPCGQCNTFLSSWPPFSCLAICRELLAIARGEQGGEQQAEAPKESAPAEPQPPRTAAEQPPGTAAGAAAAAASQLAVESAPAAAAVPSEQRQQQGEPELPVSRSARTLDVQQPQVQPAAVPQQAQAAKQVQQQSTKLEAAEAGPLPPRSWLARLCCGG